MFEDVRDYSKFKLKDEAEILSLLDGKDDFTILACNKCFKIYNENSVPESEAGELEALIKKNGKSVSAVYRLDFLCNIHRLRHFILDNNFNSSLLVAACGIGAQGVYSLAYELMPHIDVYAMCNSVRNYSGHHGMALTGALCGGCGNCVLAHTGGICPVTGCAKGLLGGQCGGAKDGKCEVNPDNDCAWEKIGKITGFLHPAPGGNYNSISYDEINKITETLQHKRSESFYGGLYLRYRKDSTAILTLKNPPLPAAVTIPMLQHAGNSAEPIVCVGDRVLTGQKIGEATGALSSCVHSSISGTVSAISCCGHPNATSDVICITIKSDGKDELHKSVRPINFWEDLDIFDIEAIIAEKGIVGMGGAGFPTPVKLKSPKPVDTILINGCESEPYITADHRVMLERAEDIVTGIRIVMKATGAQRAIIVISDNKSDAILHMESETSIYDDIFVMALWSKYPQGAERMLVARSLGRHLKYGQRPYDAGAIVINASTACAIGDAFTRGMPLIERAVTVSGAGIEAPGNYMARIGTGAADLLELCNYNGGPSTIVFGGPMMGVPLADLNSPIIKGTNGLISHTFPISGSADCIRCGRCVDACPMELLPLRFPPMAKGRHTSSGNNPPYMNAQNCIECGACDFICPSGIKLRDSIRICKRMAEDRI